MKLFQAVLVLATFLCSLVAGLLFAFAVVIMPGIRNLDGGGFIRAFQVIDGVIQNKQPLFAFVWIGSVLALVTAGVMSVWKLAGVNRLLVITAALVYVLAVQAPTFIVNVPLNDTLQRLDIGTMSETERKHARDEFEPRWNRWNMFRTVFAGLVTILLLVVILRV